MNTFKLPRNLYEDFNSTTSICAPSSNKQVPNNIVMDSIYIHMPPCLIRRAVPISPLGSPTALPAIAIAGFWGGRCCTTPISPLGPCMALPVTPISPLPAIPISPLAHWEVPCQVPISPLLSPSGMAVASVTPLTGGCILDFENIPVIDLAIPSLPEAAKKAVVFGSMNEYSTKTSKNESQDRVFRKNPKRKCNEVAAEPMVRTRSQARAVYPK
jgi:hypothetical protein